MGEHGHRLFLEIVRRQHVIGRRHERLEVPPGAACGQLQCAGIRIRYEKPVRYQRRQARPARDRRRPDPEGCERKRQGPCPMPPQHSGSRRCSADDEYASHPTVEVEEAQPGIERCLRGGDPFQQMLASDQHPDEGSPDSVAHQPCLVSEKSDL